MTNHSVEVPTKFRYIGRLRKSCGNCDSFQKVTYNNGKKQGLCELFDIGWLPADSKPCKEWCGEKYKRSKKWEVENGK